MIDEIKQYVDRPLTTDEAAQAHTALQRTLSELEKLEFQTGHDHILFKWGTLKSWDLHSDKGKALLKQYGELGASMSAMSQHDTPEQKELICQMIDEVDGIIQSDWGGEYYTKEQAKEYIRSYE